MTKEKNKNKHKDDNDSDQIKLRLTSNKENVRYSIEIKRKIFEPNDNSKQKEKSRCITKNYVYNNDNDNHSIISTYTETKCLSARSMTRSEWNIYRDYFQNFVRVYIQVLSIINNNNWTHISDISDDFNEINTLGGTVNNRTVGCFLKALKSKNE